jgi:iron complex outermembrane receptor protein
MQVNAAVPVDDAKDAGRTEELLNLSLQELLEIRVMGAAVRDIGLDLLPKTQNPFQLAVSEMPASVEIIDHNTMRARDLKNIVEAADNLVGVISGDTPNAPYSFSMRGFSRDSVGILYDGISVGISPAASI